jgi:signal transduction histidine kinase
MWTQVEFAEMAECRMRGLPMHWDLMLSNVLSNADYYSKQVPNGRILVSSRMITPDQVEIDITNDGPHVDGSARDHVFALGFTTKEGGRGLGLTVAQNIAHGLGGEILPPENLNRFVGKSRVRFRLTRLLVTQ